MNDVGSNLQYLQYSLLNILVEEQPVPSRSDIFREFNETNRDIEFLIERKHAFSSGIFVCGCCRSTKEVQGFAGSGLAISTSLYVQPKSSISLRYEEREPRKRDRGRCSRCCPFLSSLCVCLYSGSSGRQKRAFLVATLLLSRSSFHSSAMVVFA